MIKLNAQELLNKKGKTRYWLYNRLGMSHQNFKKMVENKTKSLSYKNIELMCQILECTPNDLITVDLSIP